MRMGAVAGHVEPARRLYLRLSDFHGTAAGNAQSRLKSRIRSRNQNNDRRFRSRLESLASPASDQVFDQADTGATLSNRGQGSAAVTV